MRTERSGNGRHEDSVMTLAYVVRCNFNEPARETAWNDWYNGPKLRQMLEKPHFLTGQRFRRASGVGRDYLAFWTLASADAFTTPEYTNDWGFFEWRPYIIDWSRDLFEAEIGTDVPAPRLGAGQFLRLVSFEGASAEDADRLRKTVDAARSGTTWTRSVGLDRHTSLFGFSVETADRLASPVEGVVEGLYRPISDLAITERADALASVR